jgi:hypothetical protein
VDGPTVLIKVVTIGDPNGFEGPYVEEHAFVIVIGEVTSEDGIDMGSVLDLAVEVGVHLFLLGYVFIN